MSILSKVRQQMKDFEAGYNEIRAQKYSKPVVFAEYLFSAVFEGASSTDFFQYEFYDKKKKLRSTYSCFKLKKRFFALFNNKERAHIFNNKVEFLQRFSAYIDREWMFVPEVSYDDFRAFCVRHPEFIVKPIDSSMGHGVEKCHAAENETESIAFYERLKKENALLEEVIRQHPVMAELNPSSLNTIRIAAVKIVGEFHFFGAFIRCGRKGMVVDNAGAGGLLLGLDTQNGVVISDGCDEHHHRYINHPDSGFPFHGFRIPHWEQVVAICKNALNEIPDVGYLGFDVAVKENGVELVEANFQGQFVGFQIPFAHGNKEKVLRLMEQKKKLG